MHNDRSPGGGAKAWARMLLYVASQGAVVFFFLFHAAIIHREGLFFQNKACLKQDVSAATHVSNSEAASSCRSTGRLCDELLLSVGRFLFCICKKPASKLGALAPSLGVVVVVKLDDEVRQCNTPLRFYAIGHLAGTRPHADCDLHTSAISSSF